MLGTQTAKLLMGTFALTLLFSCSGTDRITVLLASSEGANEEFAGPLAIAGRWRICTYHGSVSTAPGVPAGGYLMEMTQTGSELVAEVIHPKSGRRLPFLRGTLEDSSRLWTADLYSPHKPGSGPGSEPGAPMIDWWEGVSIMTFNPAGTRFAGSFTFTWNDGATDVVRQMGAVGALEDGEFHCAMKD